MTAPDPVTVDASNGAVTLTLPPTTAQTVARQVITAGTPDDLGRVVAASAVAHPADRSHGVAALAGLLAGHTHITLTVDQASDLGRELTAAALAYAEVAGEDGFWRDHYAAIERGES